MTGKKRKGPGGCKPKLPAHLKKAVGTAWLLPREWVELAEIGPSYGQAVQKLLKAKREGTIAF